ncbi:MAG: hypothetical protein AAF616_15380 [Bacteroidota bacterium]
MIRSVLFIIYTSLLYLKSFSQDDNLDRELNSQDTVYILLSNKHTVEINGKNSINPTGKYPEDMSRRYYFDNSFLAFNTYYTRTDLKQFYLVEDKRRFLKRDYITDDWFKDRDEKDMFKSINGKVLMIVDPTFSNGEKYYLVRVFRYAGEE